MELGVDADKKTQALGFDWNLGNVIGSSDVANGGSEVAAEKEKVPFLGDLPVTGNLFANDQRAVNAPATITAPAPSGALDQTFNPGAPGNSAEIAEKYRRNTPVQYYSYDSNFVSNFGANSDINGLYDDSYTTGKSVESAKELTKTGSGTVALRGENTFAGGTVVNAGALALPETTTSGRTTGSSSESVVKTYSLNNVSPTDVAQEMASIFPKTNPRTGQNVPPVNVVADSRLSAVVVTAPKDMMNEIDKLMSELDVASTRDQNTYVAKLNNADPNETARVLQNMFGTSAPRSVIQNAIGSTRGGGGGGNGALGAAKISVDPVTDNLVVVADAETKEQISRVLSRLDAPVIKPPGDAIVLNATNAALTVIGGKFYSGVTKDDVSGQRNLLATNNIASESANSSTNDLALNYHNVPLDTALNYLSDKAGFIIVQDTPLHGTVNLSGNHLTQEEALDQLNSALNQNGYAAVRDGRVLTIMSKNDAKTRDVPLQKAPPPPLIPQPEILTSTNAFSTFSMNVSDVSYKLAEASLQKGRMPDAASIRSEEFINAFDYRDPEAAAGQPVAFASERAQDPFAQNRDLLRFSIKTAAAGRAANRPLNLVLLLDTSGSMERADRVAIIREAMRVLAAQLHPQDTVSVVTFARTARLWADGVSGDKAGETLDRVGGITPEGGTNLEEAMRLAYQTALRHYLANGANRVVLLTDGAANLGNVDPGALKQKVEAFRKQGIALDCFGIGWEDYDDTMLAELSGNGDGRYAFINSPEEAGTDFAAKLAGALQVAAQDVKVQVEFNPQRVTSWRQIGYAKHQLTKEQFRDNSVLAAEVAAQEAGNALYTVEIKPDGAGPVATVYVRYKIPGTMEVQERSWSVPYDGNAPALEQSSAAMRLAATASAFSEWLAASPFAQEVTTDELLRDLSGVPQIYGADQRPQQLEWMIRQAKSLSGK